MSHSGEPYHNTKEDSEKENILLVLIHEDHKVSKVGDGEGKAKAREEGCKI